MVLLVVAAMLLPMVVSCGDPHSQRRIAARNKHFNETIDDMIRHDERSMRRLEEADATLKKWWRTDSERFERRLPTVGNYFW